MKSVEKSGNTPPVTQINDLMLFWDPDARWGIGENGDFCSAVQRPPEKWSLENEEIEYYYSIQRTHFHSQLLD